MRLEPLSTHSLFDPKAERKWIHFAASLGVGHLYTLQDDDVLSVCSLSQTLIPARGAQVRLPFAMYEPAHQFSNDQLVLWDGGDLVRVSCATPAQPEVRGSFTLPGMRSCAAIGERLYVERYLSDEDGLGVCALPTSQGETPTVEQLVPGRDAHGTWAAVLGERLVWATQDGLELMRPPTIQSRLRYDSVRAYPLGVSPTRLAVMEVYDDARTALSFVDVEGSRLRKVASFHPKALVRAWCLSGNRLTVVLRAARRVGGKREYTNTLVVFDVETAAELLSLPLPFVEVYGEAQTRVVWLGVRDDHCAVLLGSGELHRFQARQRQ